jgi:hypothetical protein
LILSSQMSIFSAVLCFEAQYVVIEGVLITVCLNF